MGSRVRVLFGSGPRPTTGRGRGRRSTIVRRVLGRRGATLFARGPGYPGKQSSTRTPAPTGLGGDDSAPGQCGARHRCPPARPQEPAVEGRTLGVKLLGVGHDRTGSGHTRPLSPRCRAPPGPSRVRDHKPSFKGRATGRSLRCPDTPAAPTRSLQTSRGAGPPSSTSGDPWWVLRHRSRTVCDSASPTGGWTKAFVGVGDSSSLGEGGLARDGEVRPDTRHLSRPR